MTLTFIRDLDSLKLAQYASYLGSRSSSSKAIIMKLFIVEEQQR